MNYQVETTKAFSSVVRQVVDGVTERQAVNALTNGIGLALGGHSTNDIAAGVALPYINEQIKQATKDLPELNIPSHMLWGAIEAELQGGNATSGAIAAGVGEVECKLLKPSECRGSEWLKHSGTGRQ